ncbi:Derlin-1 [Babesia sp. Xinjiang]|uniref:Derlin-1 n=1 Tax=Babesia sp. Xinjiang TaxID=462227 RepID=UPI000A22AD36|nr:Derlin-1 [Babesia sp. Xinjiang]ORM39948.1 Derlin-1 [Babesia sp. Xinjiang]
MDTYGPEAWYGGLPRITRALLTIMFLLTVLTTFRIISPQTLILDWQLIRKNYEIHRIILGCLYVGQFSFKWAIQAYMFAQFSSMLERNPVFSMSIGSYLYFILIEMLILSVISMGIFWPSGFPMLNDALLFAIIYYWSKRDMWNTVSIYMFTVKAYQLPFVMLFINFIMGAPMVVNLIGLIGGHAYYFIREVLPTRGFYNIFGRCPQCLDYLADKIDSVFNFSYLNWYDGTRSTPYTSSNRPTRPNTGFVGRGIRLGGT